LLTTCEQIISHTIVKTKRYLPRGKTRPSVSNRRCRRPHTQTCRCGCTSNRCAYQRAIIGNGVGGNIPYDPVIVTPTPTPGATGSISPLGHIRNNTPNDFHRSRTNTHPNTRSNSFLTLIGTHEGLARTSVCCPNTFTPKGRTSMAQAPDANATCADSRSWCEWPRCEHLEVSLENRSQPFRRQGGFTHVLG
jgi:hypothetical protein